MVNEYLVPGVLGVSTYCCIWHTNQPYPEVITNDRNM